MTAAQTAPKDMATFSQHDIEQIDRANATGLTPAVFIHELWDRWAALFEEAGCAA